ncbi:MAG: hypothetical protein AMXMBFR58_10440 [Phycisphaerae bacterium]|nr:hypothetical protein [Phycisphaerales bacterium]
MPDFPLFIWTVLGVCAFAGLLGSGYLVASLIRNETSVHDLKRRVAELQWEVAERAREQREREILDDQVMVVDEDVPVGATMKKAA